MPSLHKRSFSSSHLGASRINDTNTAEEFAELMNKANVGSKASRNVLNDVNRKGGDNNNPNGVSGNNEQLDNVILGGRFRNLMSKIEKDAADGGQHRATGGLNSVHPQTDQRARQLPQSST